MKKLLLLVLALLCVVQLAGCKGSENGTAPKKPAKVAAAVDEAQGKASLLSFLKALQAGDKKAAYAASNLTTELVEKNRKLIVNQPVNKLTSDQVTEAENALRTSGSIDLYLKRMKEIILKTATIDVVKTAKWSPKAPNVLIHDVKITFANSKEALTDKDGKRVKEFILRFLQIQYEVDGQLLQEFLIEDKAFEDLVNRKLDAKAYF